MKSKIEGTKKTKRIERFVVINPDAAGIDIGDTEISVAVGPEKCEENVRTYGTFTCDLLEIAAFLNENSIRQVAMEATGVYWIQLYLLLEREGFKVTLANARYIKNVSGRKDDENDAMWIQRLHSCGLIGGSFQPDWPTRQLRDLVRQRKRIVADQSKCVNRMIKALELMNIKVQTVISDIDGKTGKAIIKAILAGERDAAKLADLADRRIKASRETLIKSLQADWNTLQLFILKQQHDLYDFLTAQIREIDLQIEEQLKVVIASRNQGEFPEIDLDQKRKRTTRKNTIPFNATAYLTALLGVDVTQITGINELTALAFVSEVGADMSKWPSAKHLRSWLNIAPTTEKTGGKIKSERVKKRFHPAGQALRVAAVGVRNTNTPLGHIYRRQLVKGGPSKAILSVADKMATSFFHMVKYQLPYQPQTLLQNQEQRRINEIKRLEKRLQKLKMDYVT
jgi:transposase